MGLFHKLTDKELLDTRNKIVLETAIPTLLKKDFSKSPFSTSWYGRNNLKDFDYELCRLTNISQLEILRIYIARGDRSTKFILNIFELDPKVESLGQLNGVDGLQFRLLPNSLTEMQLRSDDIKGPPLFRLRYMNGHKLKRFYTKGGLVQNIKRLTTTIETDIDNLDIFIRRWHELHKPIATSWTGNKIEIQTND